MPVLLDTDHLPVLQWRPMMGSYRLLTPILPGGRWSVFLPPGTLTSWYVVMRFDIPISDSFRGPVRDALALQGVIAVLSALVLDCGDTATLSLVALLAFWFGVFVMVVRRPRQPTGADLWLLRWGYLPLVVIAQIGGRAWWHWRGLY